jgi:protein ImuA
MRIAMNQKTPLPSPQDIHPALWRASQLSRGPGRYTGTGYPAVDIELPGGGWPVDSLIDILIPRAGIGEIQLLRAALSNGDTRPIVMIEPPHRPVAGAWAAGDDQASRLIWVRAARDADALWAAEHTLKSGAFAAVLLWQASMRTVTARRLHLAAQAGDTLCALFRPLGAARQASPAPLRVMLWPDEQGVNLHILKRRGGGPGAHAIPVPLHPPIRFAESSHASMDRRAPAAPPTGIVLPELAH